MAAARAAAVHRTARRRPAAAIAAAAASSRTMYQLSRRGACRESHFPGPGSFGPDLTMSRSAPFILRVRRTPMERRRTIELSERERQLIELAAEGHTDASIANELGISEATVSTYWGRVRIKIGP